METKRVADILRQHSKRLRDYRERTPEADLFVSSLLPVLDKFAGDFSKRLHREKLGTSPATKYHLDRPNKALRDLCEATIQRIESSNASRVSVPDDFAKTRCVECSACGKLFLAKRADCRFCSNTCQKRVKRNTMSELIPKRG